jgi:phage baseplate assembly protein W
MAEKALVFPFTLDPNTGNIMVTTDQNAIWNQRVKMAIETLMGERAMRPTYGTTIPASTFNTVSNMENAISKQINRLFIEQLPLLSFVSVTTSHDLVNNMLSAEVTYKLPNNKETTTAVGVMVVSDTNPPYEELNR